MVQNSDIRCPRDHRPSNSIALKVQTQGTTGKKFKPKESRPKESKLIEDKNPAPLHSEFIEPKKTFHIDKKRKYLKKKQDRKNNTLATEDNTNIVEIGKKKKRDDQGDGRYYNYQKKGHFLRNCPKPPKN